MEKDSNSLFLYVGLFLFFFSQNIVIGNERRREVFEERVVV